MPTNVSNWLTRRGAGALFNLQRTPMVAGTDGITTNPKKTQANNNFSHTNQYLTNWPTKSVYKISGSQGITMNVLELETTYTTWPAGVVTNDQDPDDFLLAIVTTAGNIQTETGLAPVKWPRDFGGSDYTLYTTAEYVANEHYQADLDNDGIPEDYYNIYQVNVTGISIDNTTNIGLAYYPCTTSITYGATSPITKSNQLLLTSGQFPDWTAYADFGSTVFYATDFFTGAPTLGPYTGASFCARHPSDSAHGLASYVEDDGHVPFINSGAQSVGIIGSYRHASTDSPAPGCLKVDCECKFFYTPDACDDCWYDGKTVTIDITYKQIPFTDSGPTVSGGVLDKTVTMGSPTTHSTVTKTLTLPGGNTRQQVGATFSVPTLAGHAVVIDDIKLVSVA